MAQNCSFSDISILQSGEPGVDGDVAAGSFEGVGDDVAIFVRETDEEGGIDGDVAAVSRVLVVARSRGNEAI